LKTFEYFFHNYKFMFNSVSSQQDMSHQEEIRDKRTKFLAGLAKSSKPTQSTRTKDKPKNGKFFRSWGFSSSNKVHPVPPQHPVQKVSEQEVKEREEKSQEDVAAWRQGVSFSSSSEHVIDDLTATITMLYINLEDANERIEGLIASNERLEEKHRCEFSHNKWLTTQLNGYVKTTRGLRDTIKKLNAQLDLVYQ
jgi:hypothetical protein